MQSTQHMQPTDDDADTPGNTEWVLRDNTFNGAKNDQNRRGRDQLIVLDINEIEYLIPIAGVESTQTESLGVNDVFDLSAVHRPEEQHFESRNDFNEQSIEDILDHSAVYRLEERSDTHQKFNMNSNHQYHPDPPIQNTREIKRSMEEDRVSKRLKTGRDESVKQDNPTLNLPYPGVIVDNPDLLNKSTSKNLSYTEIEIRKYGDLHKYFDNFHKMLVEMSKEENFKAELRKMVDSCRVNEKEIKNQILKHASSNRPHPIHSNTVVELNNELIDLFADLIQGNDSKTVKLENIASFPENPFLLDLWNQTMRCIPVLKGLYPTKISKIHRWSLNSNALLFSDSFLRLLEDAIARLDFDFRFKKCVYHKRNYKNPSHREFVASYINTTAKIFKSYIEDSARKIDGQEPFRHNFQPFAILFANFFECSQTFKNAHSAAKENGVFLMIMFTRCKIIYELYSTITELFCKKVRSPKNMDSDGGIPFLVFYSHLDFRKVEMYRHSRVKGN